MMKAYINTKKSAIVALLAFLFTIMQITGYQISMYYHTTVHRSMFFQNIGMLSVVQLIILALIEFPLWYLLIYGLFKYLERIKQISGTYGRRQILVAWISISIGLFLCWLPCLLAAYPGFYNYDSFSQVPQALYKEVPYSAHHPLLHTLIMGKIIAWGYHQGGSLNDGILLHSIFQMVVCATALAYLVCYVWKVTKRKCLSFMAFIYYAFFPVIAMFTLSTTKDVIFSVLLQLCIVFLYEMLMDQENFWLSKWKVVRFGITLVLMCLFRNNGSYVVVGTCICLFFVIKKYRKRCVLLFGVTVLSYCLLSKALLWILDATEGSVEEALSVPIQQIARVYWEYGESGFDEEELELIYNGISADELLNYNPFLSDDIKNNFDYDVVKNKELEYFKLWLRKGVQYPKTYLESFLDNTYQAWYPGTSVYTKPGDGETYYFDMSMRAGGERETKAPVLLEFYRKIATEYYYQKIPVLRLLFSVGTMLWLHLFVLGYAIYRKNKPLVMAMVMPLLCCATALLGPVSLVRYYLVLFYGFPVSIGFLYAGQSYKEG